jgi:hypothetical protein
MAEWIDFDRWPECPQMERPGYVFEVTNAEQQTLLTPCVVPLEVPFDWRSPPLKFRLVAEPEPRHSDPIPAPSVP